MVGTVALGSIVFGLAGGRQVATPAAAVAASLPVASTPPVANTSPVALPPSPLMPAVTPEPKSAEPAVAAPSTGAAEAPVAADVSTPTVPTRAVPSRNAAGCTPAAGQPRWRVDIDACAKIFENRPNDAALALTIAHAHHAKGHLAQSGEWARRAIALDSQAAEAFIILARAEARAGHPAASVQAYRSYLGLVPRGWHAPEARAVVRRSDEHARKPSRVQSASSDAEGS